MRIMNIVSSCACCWSALFQLGVFFCAVHSQGPLSSLHHPLSPFHLLHVLLTPPAALHPFVGSESTQESPNKLDKTSPGADRRAVMIYANLTNRHLGTMVISTVKGGEKKKTHFLTSFFLWIDCRVCILNMHISYGQAMALLKSLAITFLSISYAFAKALYVFGLMFAGHKGRTTAITDYCKPPACRNTVTFSSWENRFPGCICTKILIFQQ